MLVVGPLGLGLLHGDLEKSREPGKIGVASGWIKTSGSFFRDEALTSCLHSAAKGGIARRDMHGDTRCVRIDDDHITIPVPAGFAHPVSIQAEDVGHPREIARHSISPRAFPRITKHKLLLVLVDTVIQVEGKENGAGGAADACHVPVETPVGAIKPFVPPRRPLEQEGAKSRQTLAGGTGCPPPYCGSPRNSTAWIFGSTASVSYCSKGRQADMNNNGQSDHFSGSSVYPGTNPCMPLSTCIRRRVRRYSGAWSDRPEANSELTQPPPMTNRSRLTRT